MSDPKLTIRSAWRPKPGHRPDEYEDAFAVSPPRLPFRAAVADGATESIYSGGWARALVEAYVAGSAANPGAGASGAHSDSPLAEAIRRARTSWGPEPDARWYVAAKAAEGAHAALFGFELRHDGWLAEAVGDCCLFHIRDDLLLAAWPIDDPDAFSHRPPLVSSRDSPMEILRTSGKWLPGDAFVFATDAAAEWLLRSESQARLIFEPVDHWFDGSNRGFIRNDDVTLLVVTISF